MWEYKTGRQTYIKLSRERYGFEICSSGCLLPFCVGGAGG
ncbi:hypothetical protein BACSTE_02428 [Bacteroides stercoris ATCC 43183]|uniref:Uncharacterized protein n=1 Tax=Bacteroides stercoris ATCC 43183 TaxID=449673 RepID=B0NSG4_BACSE|nr:hypothetical protein BACSTE_02428 [Bacteroides stercoris ATCC 43183]